MAEESTATMTAETTETATQEQQQQAATHEPEIQVQGDYLRSMMFDEKIEAETTTPIQETKQEVVETKEEVIEEEILEPAAWLKREFDTDAETLKTERNELKTLREKAKEFERLSKYDLSNEDKLYEFLSTKKSLEKLSKADLSNKELASELVKFKMLTEMQKENPSINEKEVDFLFNKRFSIPTEPVQDDIETDEEFKSRHSAWEQNKANVEMELSIEAKIAQPKIAQLSNELVLPEIQKDKQQSNEPSQEELDNYKRLQTSFTQSAEKAVNELKSLSLEVKEKDFNYKGSYDLSQEQKAFVMNKVKDFVESGFQTNVLFKDIWVNKDSDTLNVERMVKDLSKFYFSDKANEKFAADSAHKHLEAYLKSKKQINVNETQQRGTFNPQSEKTKTDKLTEALLNL